MNADTRRIQKLVEKVPQDTNNILDVGCVRHSADRRERGNLHKQLRERTSADRVVGVDLPSPEAKRMRGNGYTITEADCQTMDLGEEFDVIVAGELIEHLPKPGAFLERASEHLTENGVILLSTPNPDCLRYQAYAILGAYTSGEHTCWIGHRQLETLCERSGGLSVHSIDWIKPSGWLQVPWLCGRQRLSAPTYIAVIA